MSKRRLRKTDRRRRRGEGSILQRPDGTWVGYVLTDRLRNNRRVRRYASGLTYESVRQSLLGFAGDVASGRLTDPTQLTLGKHIDHWLRKVHGPTIAATTRDRYETTIEGHIIPDLGGIKVQKLSEIDIQDWMATVSTSIAGQGLMLLKKALKPLVRSGVLPRNPCDDLRPPKHAASEIKYMTAEQASHFLRCAVGNRLECLYVVAITTGMRKGELFGLQWGDIDFDAGFLSVRRSFARFKKKSRTIDGPPTELKEPKTKTGRRKIELGAMAINSLLDHRKAMLAAGHGSSKFVFRAPQGGMLESSNFHRESFKPLLKQAGLDGFRFHDLRHTHATMLLIAGVHPKVVQERLGHANISTTMDTYGHVVRTLQRDVAAKTDGLFDISIVEPSSALG